MLNKIGVSAAALRPCPNVSQHIDVEQDRGKRVCFEVFSKSLAAHRCCATIKVNAYALATSLNLSQHIDVEQDRGKRFCLEVFSKSLVAHRY